jgi:hypothetical protein
VSILLPININTFRVHPQGSEIKTQLHSPSPQTKPPTSDQRKKTTDLEEDNDKTKLRHTHTTHDHRN